MLTARQYEGIGRFTIAFNEIDLVVETYLPLVAQYSNYKSLPSKKDLQTFHKRSHAFKQVLKSIFTVDPVAGAYAQVVLNILYMADTVSQKRNEYVHAIATIDFDTNTRILQMRSGDIVPNEGQIFDLAKESSFVSWKLAEECESLLHFFIKRNHPVQDSSLLNSWD